ncbi:MAG: hypothetical protein U0984_05780, partial [Prosthecobacter sp.]|nr:hypothetical protein [Prosthecobacter sp.]
MVARALTFFAVLGIAFAVSPIRAGSCSTCLPECPDGKAKYKIRVLTPEVPGCRAEDDQGNTINEFEMTLGQIKRLKFKAAIRNSVPVVTAEFKIEPTCGSGCGGGRLVRFSAGGADTGGGSDPNPDPVPDPDPDPQPPSDDIVMEVDFAGPAETNNNWGEVGESSGGGLSSSGGSGGGPGDPKTDYRERFSLGRADELAFLGSLRINVPLPSVDISGNLNAAQIAFDEQTGGLFPGQIESILVSSSPVHLQWISKKMVLTPAPHLVDNGVADLVFNSENPTQAVVAIYKAAQLSPRSGPGIAYTIPAQILPVIKTTYRVATIAGLTSLKGLEVVSERAGKRQKKTYFATSGGSQWWSTVVDGDKSANTERYVLGATDLTITNVHEILLPDNNWQQLTQEDETLIPILGELKVVTESVTVGGQTRTTHFRYYATPPTVADPASAGKLRWQINPDGSWKYYIYGSENGPTYLMESYAGKGPYGIGTTLPPITDPVADPSFAAAAAPFPWECKSTTESGWGSQSISIPSENGIETALGGSSMSANDTSETVRLSPDLGLGNLRFVSEFQSTSDGSGGEYVTNYYEAIVTPLESPTPGTADSIRAGVRKGPLRARQNRNSHQWTMTVFTNGVDNGNETVTTTTYAINYPGGSTLGWLPFSKTEETNGPNGPIGIKYFLYTGSGDPQTEQMVKTEAFEYDSATGRRTSHSINGQQIESSAYQQLENGYVQETRVDEDGVTWEITSSEDGAELIRKRLAIPAHGDFAAQAEIVFRTEEAYEWNGSELLLRRTESTESAGHTLGTSQWTNGFGEIVRSEDADGRTTLRSYNPATRSLGETLPGNVVKNTVYHTDGRVHEESTSVGGVSVPSAYRSHEFYGEVGNEKHLIYRGAENDARMSWEKAGLMGALTSRSVAGPDAELGMEEVSIGGWVDASSWDLAPSESGATFSPIRRLRANRIKTIVRRNGLGTKVTEYDPLGRVVRTGINMDGIDLLSGNYGDRLSEIYYTVELAADGIWEKTSTKALTGGGGTPAWSVSYSRRKLGVSMGSSEEVDEVDAHGTRKVTTVSVNRATGIRKARTSDGSQSDVANEVAATVAQEETYYMGRLVRRTGGANGYQETFSYDGFGRLTGTTRSLTESSQVASSSTYDPITGLLTSSSEGGITRTYTRYPATEINAAQIKSVSSSTGTIHFKYDVEGRLTHQWGATHPVRYDYNAYGELVRMHTYRDADAAGGWLAETLPGGFAGDGDITEWAYHPATGAYQEKRDALHSADPEHHESYTYSLWGTEGAIKGQMVERNQGGITTAFRFNLAGELAEILYNDGITRSVRIDRDLRGAIIRKEQLPALAAGSAWPPALPPYAATGRAISYGPYEGAEGVPISFQERQEELPPDYGVPDPYPNAVSYFLSHSSPDANGWSVKSVIGSYLEAGAFTGIGGGLSVRLKNKMTRKMLEWPPMLPPPSAALAEWYGDRLVTGDSSYPFAIMKNYTQATNKPQEVSWQGLQGAPTLNLQLGYGTRANAFGESEELDGGALASMTAAAGSNDGLVVNWVRDELGRLTQTNIGGGYSTVLNGFGYDSNGRLSGASSRLEFKYSAATSWVAEDVVWKYDYNERGELKEGT